MNSYELSRKFWDFAFENPDRIKPIHAAIYFFAIEHCNRLGWKEKFGLPSQMVMEAIGVKNWRTYSQGLNELIEFDFIKLIEKSTNQYSSNIIAIVNFTKADTKALDKALQKHGTKQSKSIVSIDKQETNNKETIEERKLKFAETLRPFIEIYGNQMLNDFYSYWTEPTQTKNPKLKFETKQTWDVSRRLATWKKQDEKFNPKQEENKFKFAWQ
jgi:hypothetical protein